MEIEELTPIIYTLWPQPYFNGTLPNATNWPEEFNLTLPDSQRQTAVDDLFGFDDFQVHPIFPKIPLQYNIVLNDSIGSTPEAIYLLATSPTDRYTLCSIRASVSPNCSTNYRATTSGGTLNTNCQDNDERLTFAASNFTMTSRFPWSADWVNVASEWAMALALNDGIMDGKSSNAHLLTELIPTSPALDPQLPSISEALAVLAGNTLLLSALDSPFIHDPFNLPSPNTTQFFKAKISRQIYQSGGSQGWQRIFYIVLASVCLANLFCLMYFLHHGGLVTDFLEPQNSFCLSLLSPPSRALEGACGGGPTGEHYNKKWNIKLNEELGHLWFESSDDIEGSPKQRGSPSRKVEKEITPEDVARMYYKIRMKRTSWL